MAKIKHLHKYKRTKLGKSYVIFKCIKPDCTHYLSVNLIEDKICECNRCHGPMVMNKRAMTLASPHCDDCVKSKDKEKINKIQQYLGKL